MTRETAMIEKQFTIYLKNQPGVLAKLTLALARAKVNIEGISVAESTDTALVQLIASNGSRTTRILKTMKIPFTTQDVCVVTLKHKPGALAAMADKLSKAGVNINYIYATAPANAGSCCLVISADDLKKVEKTASA